jgi:hypothetical protein
MTEDVTVIIPTYNRASLVGRAIRSVLASTSPQDEVIVIDDGSTDNTEAVVNAFGDAVQYVRIENRGVGGARNFALRLATRPLVSFLDSDDEWATDKLTLQRAVMTKSPDVVLSFHNLQCRLTNGDVLHDLLSVWRRDPKVGSSDAPDHLSARLGPGVPFSSIAPLPPGRAEFNVHVGDLYRWLMECLYATPSAMMVRRALAGDRLRFPEDISVMEGWECSARVAAVGPVAYLDCELATQVVHEGSRLTDADRTDHISTRIRVLGRVWGSDDAFLNAHRPHYQHVLRNQHLLRARIRINEGRMNEADADLKAIGGGPLTYRLLASMPPGLAQTALSLRRRLRSATASAMPGN